MTINVFQRLRNLLPPSPLLIARVVTQFADDTSAVELPIGLGQAPQQGGVATGALMRVRGTTVPVGSNAFVRDGVIESQAPDGEPIEIVIGVVSECAGGLDVLTFTGPVADQTLTVGAAFSLALSGYFSGGYPAYTYSVIGTLPAGLSLDGATGVISGTPTTEEAVSITVRATDATGVTANTNSFGMAVTLSELVLLLNGSWTDESVQGQTPAFTGTAPAIVGSDIAITGSTGYATFDFPFAAANEPFCIEYAAAFVSLDGSPVSVWSRGAVIGVYDDVDASIVGDGGLVNAGSPSGNLTAYNGIYNTALPSAFGMATNLVSHTVSFIRRAGDDTVYIFVNGTVFTGRVSQSQAMQFIRLGKINATAWTTSNVRALRAFRGTTHYTLPVGAIEAGVQHFVPDATPW